MLKSFGVANGRIPVDVVRCVRRRVLVAAGMDHGHQVERVEALRLAGREVLVDLVGSCLGRHEPRRVGLHPPWASVAVDEVAPVGRNRERVRRFRVLRRGAALRHSPHDGPLVGRSVLGLPRRQRGRDGRSRRRHRRRRGRGGRRRALRSAAGERQQRTSSATATAHRCRAIGGRRGGGARWTEIIRQTGETRTTCDTA